MALPIALRGTEGLWMVNGPPALKTEPPFGRDDSKSCRVMIYSKDGRYFAWCNGKKVVIIQTSDFKVIQEIDTIPKTSHLMFSPKGSILATWEPYTVDKETNQGVPNLHLWDVASGNCLRAFIQKKFTYWAPQWTDDEHVCCRNVNNELQFFEDNKFDEIKTKLHLQKVAGYSLACAGPPYFVAGFVPGAKGQPNFVRVYKYPNFGGPNAAVANRTFFKADKVEMMWNKTSSAMLLLTTTETSESSYYGDQGLHFVGMNGESSLVHLGIPAECQPDWIQIKPDKRLGLIWVQTVSKCYQQMKLVGKNGPVYHVEWSPRSTEFCVVYGFMPAKATIYNMKTEPVFDFGTGPRNFGFYNPQGTILCLCGFGNLRGNMEFWDVRQQKLIVQAQSPDTTSFQWCADGEHIVTATTAPRLRVGNGYRIWHYSGVILEQVLLEKGSVLAVRPTEITLTTIFHGFFRYHIWHYPGVILEQVLLEKGNDLWEVFWQPAPPGAFEEKKLSYRPVQSDIQTPVPETKQAVYRPPGARDKPPPPKLHEYELPSNMKQQQHDPNKPMSKNKKKREAKKAKRLEEGEQQSTSQSESANQPGSQSASNFTFTSTGDPELDKKIKNVKRKLQQIDKLKEQQKAGKQLELNQLEKMKTEAALIQELEDLELS